jgi:hypothetical protein
MFTSTLPSGSSVNLGTLRVRVRGWRRALSQGTPINVWRDSKVRLISEAFATFLLVIGAVGTVAYLATPKVSVLAYVVGKSPDLRVVTLRLLKEDGGALISLRARDDIIESVKVGNPYDLKIVGRYVWSATENFKGAYN